MKQPPLHEHPVQQPIDGIVIDMVPDSQAAYWLGKAGVTKIEPCVKSGLHSDIPYVRVWVGDSCLAEFCQHNIVGVYFAKAACDDHYVPAQGIEARQGQDAQRLDRNDESPVAGGHAPQGDRHD